jgi:hypothetical protein
MCIQTIRNPVSDIRNRGPSSFRRMRIASALALALAATSLRAGEIREFSIPTLERLGNELTRVSQSSDRGASDAARKRARETAVAALQGKLFDTRYDYVVLSDPDGKRLLVYALAAAKYTDQVVLAGHFRVTVSADGTKAERVDALSKSLAHSGPAKTGAVALWLIQIVSNKPVETLIYTSNLANKPIYVRTPDGKTWEVGEGKMRVARSKPSN